jgi:hypothetical protein
LGARTSVDWQVVDGKGIPPNGLPAGDDPIGMLLDRTYQTEFGTRNQGDGPIIVHVSEGDCLWM